MLDALAELLLRSVGGFLVDVVVYSVFYPIGWLMLTVVTLGRYPPPPPATHNREFVAGIPLVALLVGITIAFS